MFPARVGVGAQPGAHSRPYPVATTPAPPTLLVSGNNARRLLTVCTNDARAGAIRCDWDRGFEEGRQYGRGKSGGQVRDEFRETFDEDRGGYGQKGLYTRGLLVPTAAESAGQPAAPETAAPTTGQKRAREDESGLEEGEVAE